MDVYEVIRLHIQLLYIYRSQHAYRHFAFPPSFPPPLPASLWQVNKINIHPPVAMAGMSDSLSCHQPCVCVVGGGSFDACV